LFVFSVGLCFGLRTKCLQSRHSTPWATLPVHFALVILEGGGLTNYLPGLSLNLKKVNAHPALVCNQSLSYVKQISICPTLRKGCMNW
jgi:hypothetical protein